MSSEAAMFLASDVVTTYSKSTGHDLPVEELILPGDFKWGVATAVLQIEGGADQDGKGKSIWDTFSHMNPSRTNNENPDVSCDHYNLWEEDVELMSNLGADVYRFSIAWSRVIPLGSRNDPVNEKGIEFYSNLIDKLLAKNIAPVVTLYHWDAPQGLYNKYKLFLDTEEFTADFENYARLCFSRFGDRVKSWITFNEPYIISIFGHHSGVVAPGHNMETGFDTKKEPWKVGHALILSHAAVVQLYHREFKPTQKGTITIVLNGHLYEPFDTNNQADIDAAERRLIFYVGWFGDPVFLGQDYPACMRQHLGSRLPEFTSEDRQLLRETAPLNAFYGMNHYSTKYARALPGVPADDDWTGHIEETSEDCDGTEIGPASGFQWLRLPIIVTENGCPCPNEDNVEVAINDTFRQRYIGLYLDAISRAIYEDKVPVLGYYAWSLMDNFEWSAGYAPRYGIVHTDYTTLKRTPKGSAYYLKDSMVRRRTTSE
ncbi:glycoside hydrolase superfamily [Leptodontidium sp. 2 PMI_412]|nr:glycoside hydrolase superfamily [Leptodontidium sp. 2 PMI_412]